MLLISNAKPNTNDYNWPRTAQLVMCVTAKFIKISLQFHELFWPDKSYSLP